MAAIATGELYPAAHTFSNDVPDDFKHGERCTLSSRCDQGLMGDLNLSRQEAEGQAGHLTASNVAPCRDNQSVVSVQPAE